MPDHDLVKDSVAKPEAILAYDYVSDYFDTYNDYANVNTEVLVILLLLNVVAKPSEVYVIITRSVNTVVLEFDISEGDKGRVIGRDGKTIITLRHLCRAVAGSSGKEYFIRLLGDGNPPNKIQSRVRSLDPRDI